MTNVSDILGGAFGLLKRHPGAVLVWAVIHALIGLGAAWITVKMIPQMFDMMSHIDPENPESVAAMQMKMMTSMGGFQALSWGMQFVSSFAAAVVMCAAFRATIRPEEGGFAFLRIGWDEFRTFLMMIVISMALAFVAAIGFLILFLIGMIVAFLTSDTPAISVLVGIALFLVGICALFYLLVRLSLIYAVSFIRGQLTVDEAWAITRGRFWTLFGAFLVIVLVMWVLSSIVTIPMIIAIFNGMGTMAQHMPADGAQVPPDAAFAMLGEWFSANIAWLAIAVVLASALQGVSWALFGGAMATAARDILIEDGRLPAGEVPPEA